MRTFSIQYALFPLLLLLSGSSYWFLQVRSNALQAYKNEHLHSYPRINTSTEMPHNNRFIPPTTEQTRPSQKDKEEFEEDRSPLPDVQLLKFILDKSKEGLPVLRLPNFLYR